MPPRKLTLLFEADSTAAIRSVRSLADEVTKLNNLLIKSEGTDSLKGFSSVVGVAQAFTNALTQAQAKLSQLGQYNQVSSNISNWQIQNKKFNSSLEESLGKVKNLANQAGKSFGELQKLAKPIDVTINAKVSKDKSAADIHEETLTRSQRIKQDAEYIQRNLNRRVEAENREIKKDLAKQRIVETRQRQVEKATRSSKAEQILAKFSTPEPTSFFKSDELRVNTPTGTQYATARQIEEARQVFESKAARRARNEKVFGSVNQSASTNESSREEVRQSLGGLFNERLKQQVAENARKNAEKKKELEERYRVLSEQKRVQEEQEKRQAEKLASARRKGLKFEEATQETKTTSTGIGYGKSNIRTTDQIAKDRLASGAPTFRGSIANFGMEALQRRVPQGLQDVLQGTNMIAESLSLSKFAAIGVGAAISGGIVVAMTTANFAIGEFNRQLQVATKDQLALLGISSETQRLYKVDQKTADDFYQTLQTRTEIAGRDTSVSAEDITDLNQMGITAYITAFKDSGRSLDDLSKQIVDTNTRFAILAQATPGVTNFQVKNAYTSAITGNLNNALTRQEFFRNSGFADVVKQTAAENKIDLTKATQIEQIDVLQKALEKRVPKTLVDRAQNDSIDAQISSFQDKLFSQRVGIFGIQRDLDPEIEGNQSLFTEIGRTIKLVLGQDGFFDQLGKVFSNVDFDLIEILRNGLRSLNDFLELLNKLLSGITAAKNKLGSIPIAPGANLGDAFNTVGALRPWTLTDAVRNGLFSATASAYNGIMGFFSGNSYTGNYPETPTDLKPIAQAIQIENAHKPRNSSLLIANDSEYIFPNQQAIRDYAGKHLPSINQGSSQNITVSPNAIVIHASQNQQASDIANQVILALNNIIDFQSQTSFS